MNGLRQALEARRDTALDQAERCMSEARQQAHGHRAQAFADALELLADYDPTAELHRARSIALARFASPGGDGFAAIHALLELADAKLAGTGRAGVVAKLVEIARPELGDPAAQIAGVSTHAAVTYANRVLSDQGITATALERRLAEHDLEQGTPTERPGASGRSRLVAVDDLVAATVPEPHRATIDATDYSRKV